MFAPYYFGHCRFLLLAFLLANLPAAARADHANLGTHCLSAPALPAPVGNIVNVSTVAQLQNAVSNGNLVANTTILLAPGDYHLDHTLAIGRENVTLRGATNACDDVVLIGKGMTNSTLTHGVWTDQPGLKVQNLTIRDVYHHPIALNAGANSPHIYNVKLLNAGQQFIKASGGATWGQGVNDGLVEYTIMEYTDGPPTIDTGGGTGYTQGLSIHGGQRWVIRNNLFKNFSTPDSADHLWNPAVLMWRGSGDTLTENNVFIDVDRAIAYGLSDDANGPDHTGGIIRNNMIYYSDGLYGDWRKNNSDGSIIVWDSEGTQVLHNTVLSNGNLNKSIEFRFDTAGGEARNNLVDAPITGRSGAPFDASGNATTASANLFVGPAAGNLHLKTSHMQVPALADALFDVDGQARTLGTTVDVGADEFVITLGGDFDLDTDVDGADFLRWQRGGSNPPLSPSGLADWQANFGTPATQRDASTPVPEPPASVILMSGILAILFRSHTVRG